jgi:hypothetical protein
MQRPRARVTCAALLSTSILLLGGTTLATAAPKAAAATATIRSGKLTATADTAFPQVLQYQLGTGTLPGNNGAATLENLVIDDLGTTVPGLPTCWPSASGPIVGAGSDRCIDVPNSDATDGTRVALWDCNGGANQTWAFAADGTIRSLGKCLDVTGHGTADGTGVTLWDCHGGANQQWTYDTATKAYKGVESGSCLDTANGNTANGTLLEIRRCTGGTSQQWSHPS